MKQYAGSEPELRKYLLGELVSDDALRVEARLFLEEEYARLLKAAEDDLVDEYVSGELTGDERERFERHFLSDPARQDDLKVARALRNYITWDDAADAAVEEGHRGLAPPATTWWSFLSFAPDRRRSLKLAAAFAILLVAAGGAWLVFNTLRRPTPPESARVREQPAPRATNDPGDRSENSGKEQASGQEERPGAQESQTPAPSDGGRPEPTPIGRRQTRPPRPPPGEARPPSGAFAVMLIPGAPAREEGGVKEVAIPPRGSTLTLQLPLLGTPGHRSYEATLYAEDGRAVHSWSALSPTSSKPVAYVAAQVPAGLLSPQHYQVKLRAALPDGRTSNVSSYHFRAVNK